MGGKPDRSRKGNRRRLSTSEWLEKTFEIRPQQLKQIRDLMKIAIPAPPPRGTVSEQLFGALGDEDPSEVRRLLDAGADPNIKDKDGRTPLMDAVSCGRPAAMQLLLEAGADPHARDSLGISAWGYVQDTTAYKCHKEMLQILCDAGAEISQPVSFQLVQAVQKGDVREVTRLLAAGAEVDAKTDMDRTALGQAAEVGNVEIVKILLEAGADPNGRSFKGRTPLMHAASMGHETVVRMLIDRGADVLMDNPIEFPPPDYPAGRFTAAYYAKEFHSDLAELLGKLAKRQRNKLRDKTPKPQRLAGRFGVESRDADYLMLLIHADLADAMRRMAFVTGIDNWKYGKPEAKVRLRPTSFAMLQCRGQQWTIASAITPIAPSNMDEIAEELSSTLDAKVICLVAQGAKLSCKLYEDGDLSGQIAGKASAKWCEVEALLQKEEAYLPAIPGPASKTGQLFSLSLPASIDPADLVGMRYITAP